MNTHEKIRPKSIHPMAPIATALSVMLLAACSVPVQVPIQTKPQQPPAFIDELKQKLPNATQPGSAAPQLNPLESNKRELPAAAPATVPEVVWPARGAGDFETAVPAAPIYWYTVGVDERELIPVVAAPAGSQAGVDIHDRHLSLFESVPAQPQKTGEDVHDRHPSLLGAVAANPMAEAGDFDRLPRLTPIAPVTNPKAGEDLSDRHPQSYPGGPRVNLRADELLNGPDQSANSAQAAGAEQVDDMWYRDPSRNDR